MIDSISQSAQGVLPDHMLTAMIARGEITATHPVPDGQIQPASLDLRLGTTAYRVRASFLTGAAKTVTARLPEFTMHEMDLTPGAVLEKGCVYVIPLMEGLALPQDITAVCNAKSSTGRVDCLTRVIADNGIEFDRIPAGYKGPLYAEICPRSFSVKIEPGLRLNQIRFRRGHATLSDDALRDRHAKTPLVDQTPLIDEGLGFSVDLSPKDTTLVGYRAKPHTGVIDLTEIGTHHTADFWEEIHTSSGQIILDPGAFYILVSREAVTIPPDTAAEMAPYLAMVGEFRVHYAGFFDPGFGHGVPARGVLEVRCHEAPFVLEHGQTVGRLVYETMASAPTQLYGTDIASNYQGQGLKLSKHFK